VSKKKRNSRISALACYHSRQQFIMYRCFRPWVTKARCKLRIRAKLEYIYYRRERRLARELIGRWKASVARRKRLANATATADAQFAKWHKSRALKILLMNINRSQKGRVWHEQRAALEETWVGKQTLFACKRWWKFVEYRRKMAGLEQKRLLFQVCVYVCMCEYIYLQVFCMFVCACI
jgi:hypothetical protein